MEKSLEHEARNGFNLFVDACGGLEGCPDEVKGLAWEFYRAGFSDGGRLGAQMTGDAIGDDIRQLLKRMEGDSGGR